MIDLILVALFQAAAGDPAPAHTPATPQANESTDQAAESPQGQNQAATEEPRRCRREVVVGTRMTRRVCTTASEDREAAREARDFVQGAQGQTPLQGN